MCRFDEEVESYSRAAAGDKRCGARDHLDARYCRPHAEHAGHQVEQLAGVPRERRSGRAVDGLRLLLKRAVEHPSGH